MTAGPRYEVKDGVTVCLDCGVVVAITEAHTRSHSIMSSWAWMLAVLKTSHVAAHIHDQYDVVERIDSRKFDNWSADALAEVVTGMKDDPVTAAAGTAGYVHLLPEGTHVARTIEVSDSVMVDVDVHGRPVGVETLGEAGWESALVSLAMRGKVRIT